MALSATLEKEGFRANEINTSARVHFGKVGEGFAITQIDLDTKADISGIEDNKFQEIADQVKETCPVSKALSATPINLKASLAKQPASR